MRINLELARSHGLEIDIQRKGKDDFLTINPIEGQRIESLQAVHKELVEVFGVNSREAEGLTDDFYGVIHTYLIWAKLKDLDERGRVD